MGRARDTMILVHGYRLAYPDEKMTSLESETTALKQWRKTDSVGAPLEEEEPDLAQANAWFLIRDTAEEGLKVSEIFRGLPEDDFLHSRSSTNCLVVGSKLYEIGGFGSTVATRFHLSNKIRCLDTQNPKDGWKTDTLPFHCAGATATVSGKSIYLFPYLCRFMSSTYDWAYVYDTEEQKARPLQLPPECPVHTHPGICIPSWSSEGVVVPLKDVTGCQKFSLHNTTKDSWKSLAYPQDLCQPYAVSDEDGLLYICCQKFMVLSVYNITNTSPRLICKINLPRFENHDPYHDMFLVPVADSNLCFLWHADQELFYAKVSVSLDPPAATLVKQATMRINAIEISECLPFSIPPGMHLQQYNIGAKFPVFEYKKKKPAGAANLEQVEDMRRLCKRLLRHLEDSETYSERSVRRRNRLNSRSLREECRSLREELHRVLSNRH